MAEIRRTNNFRCKNCGHNEFLERDGEYSCLVCSQVTDRLHDEELEVGGGVNDGALAGDGPDTGYAVGRGIRTQASSARITKKQKLEMIKEALQGNPLDGGTTQF